MTGKIKNLFLSPTALKILIFLLILSFYGLFLIHKIPFPTDDLGRHLKNGELVLDEQFKVLTTNFYSYTEGDLPFVNHHWLSGVVFYLLTQTLGFGGLVIFKMIILLVTLAVLFLASLKKADFWLVAFFSLPTILILIERTDVRPEIFSYLFIAVFLYLLVDLDKYQKRKIIFWLIPLQLLWVNLHIFFYLGPVLVAGFLLEKIILNYKNIKNNQLIKKSAWLLVALILVSFINPSGVQGALYPLSFFNEVVFVPLENQSIFEFMKTNSFWGISISLFYPLVFLLIVSFILAFKRKQIFYFLIGAGSALASFLFIRNLSLFGLMFLPVISANFNEVFNQVQSWLKVKKPATEKTLEKLLSFVFLALILGLFFFATPAVISKNRESGLGLTHQSNEAAMFFKEQNLRGPIFNDYDGGGYLVYHFFPLERVFIDNVPESFSPSFFTDTYLPMLNSEEKWQTVSAKYNFNALFIYNRNASPEVNLFLRRRLNDPNWLLVYADTYFFIFLKNIPANQETIKKFQITKENIGEKISYLVKSKKQDDVMSAGNIFYLMGRQDLAMEAFKSLVARWPDNSRVWLVMGAIQSTKDDDQSLASAVAFLEKAVALGETTAESYTLLGLAYLKSNQQTRAREFFNKALKIDPDRPDLKDYLKQLDKY